MKLVNGQEKTLRFAGIFNLGKEGAIGENKSIRRKTVSSYAKGGKNEC